MLGATNGDNDDVANSNNITFTIKDTQLYVPIVTLPAKDNQNYENVLGKDLKDQCIRRNI